MDDFDWFVGFDWAGAMHHACVHDGAGRMIVERDIAHHGGALAEFFDGLLKTTSSDADKIAIAIETPHGPIVEGALERGFAVFSINPKQLDRFRDRFTVAGAKDDSRDAHVMADSLRTDRRAFRRLAPDEPLIMELREWSRIGRDLGQERDRLTNRLREQLWRYYPQALKLTDDLHTEWFLKVWELMPAPASVKQSRRPKIAQILASHRVRRVDADGVLQILREKPLSVSPGAVTAATAHIGMLIVRIRLLNAQIKKVDARLDELHSRIAAAQENEPGQNCGQRDVMILQSLPGVGRTTLAALLSEAAKPVEERNYAVLRALSGVAPVTRRSGKSLIVIRRHACNRRLREAVYHWARVSVQHDPASRSRYAALRARGHNHARALRGVADRLLYVACKMLERQVAYDPEKTRQSRPGVRPSFCSTQKGHPSVPTCLPAESRAQAAVKDGRRPPRSGAKRP